MKLKPTDAVKVYVEGNTTEQLEAKICTTLEKMGFAVRDEKLLGSRKNSGVVATKVIELCYLLEHCCDLIWPEPEEFRSIIKALAPPEVPLTVKIEIWRPLEVI